jgi:alkylation response protein AidB-like acyl-CoA dehydrogenase
MSASPIAAQPGPYDLSPFHLDLRAQARELAAQFADRHREVRLYPFEHGELHRELWGAICERGWPGLLFAEPQASREGWLLPYVLVMEALAERNLLLWMPVLGASIGYAIAEVGPQPVRERWLPRLCDGEAFLALAVTEPDCGHNVFRTSTTVERDGERFLVNGLKAVTSGTDLVDRLLVFGRAPNGERDAPPQFTTVLVDPDAPGVEREELHMGGREGLRQFQLTFTDVEVPAEDLVGVEGQGLLALWPFTHIERVLTAALALGQASYCLGRALERAKDRTIFGKRPIGAEQSIQHPLADVHARIEASRLLVYRTAQRFDEGADPMAVAADANIAKVLTADLVYDAADRALQTLGGPAWEQSEGMIDVFLDARAVRSFPISQELALNFIAQHVLGLPSHR